MMEGGSLFISFDHYHIVYCMGNRAHPVAVQPCMVARSGGGKLKGFPVMLVTHRIFFSSQLGFVLHVIEKVAG